jgi:hypothetical protein
MKVDQLNNFTTEKINEVLASRFGQTIDLSEESIDNLNAFQNAIARELADTESSIGFNRSMQNPKYVENKLISDLIAKSIEERQVSEELYNRIRMVDKDDNPIDGRGPIKPGDLIQRPEVFDPVWGDWGDTPESWSDKQVDAYAEEIIAISKGQDPKIEGFDSYFDELQDGRPNNVEGSKYDDDDINDMINDTIGGQMNWVIGAFLELYMGKDRNGPELPDAELQKDALRITRDPEFKKSLARVRSGQQGQVGEDMPAKVKRISGTKVDIEDPDEPGITKTVDTTKTDVDVDDATGELELDPRDKKETPAQQKIKIGQTVKKSESDEGTGEEGDDIEDMVAPEFEQIIHMLKSGISPDEIKEKMPDHADIVDQVVNDLAAVTEAMNNILPEGNVLSGVEQSALRLLVGTKDFMRAKRAIEFARAGRAIPSDLVRGLIPLFDKIGTFLKAGAGAVKRFGDIEKMIGRTVHKDSAYEDKLHSKIKIKESEIDKAEVALAAKDMVDKVDSMLQDVSQMKGEDLLPLTDKVRDEVGQEASDTLKTSVEGSLGELETALQSARATLDNAARTVAGDPTASAGDPMGADPLADPLADPMGADPTNPDELNTLDVPDGEIGGEDPEGREKRESAQPTRTKHQIAEAIFSTLSRR